MWKVIIYVAFMNVFMSGCHQSDNANPNPNPIIKAAYDSLLSSEKNEIEGDWKNATLKEGNVNNKIGILTDLDYDGEQAYIVVFYTGNNHSSGDIDVYVSKDKMKVIGKGYRE